MLLLFDFGELSWQSLSHWKNKLSILLHAAEILNLFFLSKKKLTKKKGLKKRGYISGRLHLKKKKKINSLQK